MNDNSETYEDSHPALDESLPLSERAIHVLREQLPRDQWDRLDAAVDDFSRALKEKREVAQEVGLTSDAELSDLIRRMKATAKSELAKVETSDDLIDGLERAVELIRETPVLEDEPSSAGSSTHRNMN